MIRETGNLLHPTLTPRVVVAGKLPAMVMSTILDPMAVMLAYKVAASELVGWPETKTVGEQFHVYPAGYETAESLSFMVKSMYDHCKIVARQYFLGEGNEAVDNPVLDSEVIRMTSPSASVKLKHARRSDQPDGPLSIPVCT